MEALCHPSVKLTSIMPINCEHGTEQLLKCHNSGNSEDISNAPAVIMSGSTEISQYPLLVGHMIHRSEMEGLGSGHWSFREVLDKLLVLVVLPVRQMLSGVRRKYSPRAS